MPAIIELNNGSEITMLYCKKSKASTIQDNITVPYNVLMTTRLPNQCQAAQNIGTFKITFHVPTDSPVR